MDRYTSADKQCNKPCKITHISSQFRSAIGHEENGRRADVYLEFTQKEVVAPKIYQWLKSQTNIYKKESFILL